TIVAHARPGDSALFQDAGATPFRALDVSFSDPIGVVDRTIAHMLADARVSPFRDVGTPELQTRLRNELLARNPRFIALVAYIPREREREVAESVRKNPEETLSPYLRTNGYAHGIPDDPRFHDDFRFVGFWRRSDGYYLALYERPLLRSNGNGVQDP